MFRLKKIVPTLLIYQLTILSSNFLFAEKIEFNAIEKEANENLDFTGVETCKVSKSGKFQPIGPLETTNQPQLDNGGVRVNADDIQGIGSKQAEIKGNVIIEQNDQVLNANQVNFDNNQIYTQSLFKLKNSFNVLQGTKLKYDLVTQLGEAENFKFRSLQGSFPLQGEGGKIEILGKNFYQLKNARVNTCLPGDDSWFIESPDILVDYDKNIGVAKHTKFVFKDVPIFYVPWFDFPLNGNRKSGFLSPTLGLKSGNGVEIAIPYYFNLAPNYDMTLTPHLYSKRGLAMDAEFRYLTTNMQGILAGSYLPSDRKAKDEFNINDRYAISLLHLQNITPKLFFGIDYNQVSDNNYFRDLGSRTASAENNNLNRQIWLNYQDNLWDGPFSAFFTIQNYQTLQNASHTIDEPYRLEPQITLNWSKFSQGTSEFDVLAQFTNFSHRTKQTGFRSLINSRMTWNFSNEWGFIRPRVGLSATNYQLDDFWGKNQQGQQVNLQKKSISRVLPLFSLDSGLVFERSFKLKNNDYVQTLEPRIFYTYIPKRDQSQIPNFDSEEIDTTFSSLFRENQFTGYDRINAANNLSYSVISRFYDKNNGVELFSAGIGQRRYFDKSIMEFNEEKLNLTKKDKTDTLLFAQGRITDKISLQTDLYFNGESRENDRYVVGLRYTPAEGRLINIRYKNDKNSPWIGRKGREFEQVDLSFQWAINHRYSILGRYNYSISDKKRLESLFGVEYLSECGCWGMNAVYQTYLTEYDKRKNAVFFQLNLKGLGGVGVNPFTELYRSIPGFHPRSEVR